MRVAGRSFSLADGPREEVAGDRTQRPALVDAHVGARPSRGREAHRHGFVKEGGRRISDGPLPGSRARAQGLALAPSGHDDATTRVVAALDARDQEGVRASQALDAHSAARHVPLAVPAPPQGRGPLAGMRVAGSQADRPDRAAGALVVRHPPRQCPAHAQRDVGGNRQVASAPRAGACPCPRVLHIDAQRVRHQA